MHYLITKAWMCSHEKWKFLVHKSNFGWMLFLMPPMIDVHDSETMSFFITSLELSEK